MKGIFLKPGDLYYCREETELQTILGSCVSVCLYDRYHKYGGMTHYTLATCPNDHEPTNKFGNIALRQLIFSAMRYGARKEYLEASLYGGASFIESYGKLDVASKNISIAKSILDEENIPIITESIGGNLGRKLLMNTQSNTITCSIIKGHTNNL